MYPSHGMNFVLPTHFSTEQYLFSFFLWEGHMLTC
jgi:hypothetical protein